MSMAVRLVDAEALRIGPNDVLIVKGDFGSNPGTVAGLLEAFESVGLKDRVLVINTDQGEQFGFTVAEDAPRDRCVVCGLELLDDDHKTSEHGDGHAHDECIAGKS